VRFVIDTNLLVSAIISTGLPRQLLDAARAGEFELAPAKSCSPNCSTCSAAANLLIAWPRPD
jgi:predicted nucleic acid-binding protein